MPLFSGQNTAALLVSIILLAMPVRAGNGRVEASGVEDRGTEADLVVVFHEVDGEIEVLVEDIDELEDDVMVIFYEVNGEIHVMLRQ